MFCQKCGKPSETPICPECAAAEAPVEAPVMESAAPVEPPVEAPAPEAAPAVEEPVIDLGAPEEAPKKKSKKGLWISLIAIVAAIAVAAVAFWPTITKAFRTPDEQLRDVTKATLGTYTDLLADAYGSLLKDDTTVDFNNAKVNLGLEMDQSLSTLLSTALKAYDVNLSAADLSKITLGMELTQQDEQLIYLGLNASLSTKEVLAVKAFLDMQNAIAYLGVPQLSEQYLKLDLSKMGIDLNSLLSGYGLGTDDGLSLATASSLTSVPNLFANSAAESLMGIWGNEEFRNAMPSEDDFAAMLDGYFDAVLNKIVQVEETTETVTVGTRSQEQTVLTAKITETNLYEMGKAVLEYAQNDATLKQMLDAVDAAVKAEVGYELNLYNSMIAAIPEAIAAIDQQIAKAEAGNYLVLKAYTNGDELLGVRLGVCSEGSPVEETLLFISAVEEGDTDYFEVTLPAAGQPILSGSVTDTDDATNLVLNVNVDGVTLKIELDCSDNTFRVKVTPPAEALQSALSGLGLPAGTLTNGLAIEFFVSEAEDNQSGSMRLALLMGDTSLVALTLDAATGDGTVTLPENVVDINDQTQIMTWAYSALGKLPEVLGNLGISEDTVSDLLGNLMGF